MPRARRRLRRRVSSALQRSRQALHGLADLRLGDVERRQQAHDVVAGADGQQLLGHARGHHVAHRRLDLDAGQQAAAAHLLDHVGMLVLDARQLLLEAQPRVAHLVEEARLQHGIEHRIADRHGQRIAAVGRAVRAGHHALGRLLGGQEGAERKAAADALGHRHDVGRDAGPFVREQLAGAAHAALHLVEHQQQAVLVAQLAQGLEELRGDAHAALALHRLDHDGGGLGPDGLFRRLEVAEGHEIEAGRRLAEAFQVLLVAGGGDGGERAAVEGALEGDDAPPLGLAVGEVVAPRQLDGALAGFGARIAEEHLVGERGLAQPLGETLLAGDAVEIGAVPQLARLLGQRRDQLGMGMAQRVDGDAAGEIEIALAAVETSQAPSPRSNTMFWRA